MTRNETVKINGAIVLWSLASHTNRENLETRLNDAGFTVRLPQRRSQSVLREALQEVFPGTLVRETKTRGELEVLEEQKGSNGRNHYIHLRSALIDGNNQVQSDITSRHMLRRLQEKIAWFNNQLTSYEVSRAIVSVISSLGGTPLRDGGAVYWLDSTQLPQWTTLKQIVESTASRGTSCLYSVLTRGDEDTIRCISDAVTKDIESVADMIEVDLLDEEVSETIVRNRKKTLDALRSKMQAYEQSLDTSLTRVQEVLNHVSTTAAAAELVS